MGHKYPLQSINWVKSIQLGNTVHQSTNNQIDHKSNQNTFAIGKQSIGNKLNDIYRRDTHSMTIYGQ